MYKLILSAKLWRVTFVGFFAVLGCSTSFCFANGFSGESFQQTSSRHLYILYPERSFFPFVPEWVERQFQKVCELWGYTADSLLKDAQLRLQSRLKTIADAPGWLKSSALPRITLVYTKLAFEYCDYKPACVRVVFLIESNEVSVRPDLAHVPYPGDLGIEVILGPNCRSSDIFHEFGHAVLYLLLLDLNVAVPRFWDEGFAEYMVQKLDYEAQKWPYRAYARLAFEDFPEHKLHLAISGEYGHFYEPYLASQLMAFICERWGREKVVELFRILAQASRKEEGIARCLGINVDELLKAWHEWLAEAEITESVRVWRFSEKAHLKARANLLFPLMGPVRYRWVKGLLERIPRSGTWDTLRNLYPFLEDPVRTVVTQRTVESLLQLFPLLLHLDISNKGKVLKLLFEFEATMRSGDVERCVEIYLRALDAAFGPLPPLPSD